MTLLDLDLYPGKTFSLLYSVVDSGNNPINLSGYNLRATIKDKYSSITGTGSFICTGVNLLSGQIVIYMSPTGTLALPVNRYIYDLEAYLPNSGDAIPILYGYVNLNPQCSF